MSVKGEPTEESQPGKELESTNELFPVGLELSELVAEFPREEISARLASIVVENDGITADFYRETSHFIERIKAETRIDWEKAVDDDEKHALSNRRQMLHQIGLIVLLLDTYWQLVDSDHEDLAAVLDGEIKSRRAELIYELTMLLEPRENAPTLINTDYFESILQKVEGLTAPE